PVPVVRLSKRENRLGGAANVALNLRAMGAHPILCSVIGKDQAGGILQELLPQSGLSNRGLVPSDDRQTTVKTRVIAQSQHLLRVDQEDQDELSPQETEDLLQRIRQLLESKPIHLIIFQDYNKGVLTDTVIKEVILEAIKRDIPTAVDPKRKNFWAYKHVHLFKPNLKEVNDNLPFKVTTDLEDLRKAADYIQNQLGNTVTLITLSEKGLYYKSTYQEELVPTQPRSIADVCGAGDTVISVAALAVAAGMDLAAATRLANIAGGQVCERVGVVPVEANQLLEEFTATSLLK
ncbi:MAG: carbohydrate kinase, partial [Phaeodactylibacter sp.]|nr:carbohydrate kinase [Phaeodactylibacter sp.]